MSQAQGASFSILSYLSYVTLIHSGRCDNLTDSNLTART